jgi:hypothetical protein
LEEEYVSDTHIVLGRTNAAIQGLHPAKVKGSVVGFLSPLIIQLVVIIPPSPILLFCHGRCLSMQIKFWKNDKQKVEIERERKRKFWE